MKTSLLIVALISSVPAFALTMPVQTSQDLVSNADVVQSSVTEFDPSAPNAQQMLDLYDQAVEAEGGTNWLGQKPAPGMEDLLEVGGCSGSGCPVYAVVNQRSQTMTLRTPQGSYGPWQTSTGVGGRTPSWSGHPNGRIYTAHTSNKYPGGDYNGLGNMPYAVFLFGGYAIHGTPRGNWGRLGSPASHGCIRIHPSNAQLFNQIVRQYGRGNVWVTVN